MTAPPSTTALRVFLATIERGSTAAAAEAINLTQSAVSKQIKALEDQVGASLFRRTARGLVPTEAGEVFRPYAAAALEQIALGRRRVAEAGRARAPVRIHLVAIAAERFLIPRFSRFAEAHPGIDVQFTHFVSESDTAEPDLEIAPGEGERPADAYLFGRGMALFAAPALIERAGGITCAADVERLTLLQHFQSSVHWAEFTEAFGRRGAVPAHTIRYGYFGVIIRAAVAGLGVALLPRVFAADEVAAGTLVTPAGLSFRSASGYHLTRRRTGAPEVDALASWILAEARAYRGADG